MRKKMWIFHVAYYVLLLLIYACFFFISTKLFPPKLSIGMAKAVAYGFFYVATPMVVAVLMRFSFLKWYVDPIAALEVPLFIYVRLIHTQMSRSDINFYDALLKINGQLSADGIGGWFFLIGLFVFGLAASFSLARKKGKSISYRLISKFIA